jgi:hypothetical protein
MRSSLMHCKAQAPKGASSSKSRAEIDNHQLAALHENRVEVSFNQSRGATLSPIPRLSTSLPVVVVPKSDGGRRAMNKDKLDGREDDRMCCAD